MNKKELLEKEINTLKQSKDYITELNNNLKSRIDVNWKKIITQNLNNNPEELKKHLLALGYSDDKKKTKNGWTLAKITKYIKNQMPSILNNDSYITDTEYNIKQKQTELDNISSTLTGVTLLKRPIPMDIEKTIGTYQNLVNKNSTSFNYNYAISCWVFIHNYGTNLSSAYVVDTPLLNYGNRPAITWNGKINTLKIKMRDVNNNVLTVFKTNKIPLQKWVNIVINYNGGTLDVFIDNKLVASERNIIPYMAYDKIVVGANNGISGGICNVTYYDNVLTKNQIDIYYNLLKNKNPPDCLDKFLYLYYIMEPKTIILGVVVVIILYLLYLYFFSDGTSTTLVNLHDATQALTIPSSRLPGGVTSDYTFLFGYL